MSRLKWPWFVLVAVLWMPFPLEAGEDAKAFVQARKAARKGNPEFAYMHYRSILNRYPGSKFEKEALFAQGEYHYLLPDYPEAIQSFQTYVEKYSGSSGEVFALAHLLKIARLQKKETLAQELESKIIALKPVKLVFRHSKEYKYYSPLARRWKAVFHIDKIEFFVGGELFEQIFY